MCTMTDVQTFELVYCHGLEVGWIARYGDEWRAYRNDGDPNQDSGIIPLGGFPDRTTALAAFKRGA